MGMIEERDESWAKWRAEAAADHGQEAVLAAWMAAQESGEDQQIGHRYDDGGQIRVDRITPDGYVWGE